MVLSDSRYADRHESALGHHRVQTGRSRGHHSNFHLVRLTLARAFQGAKTEDPHQAALKLYRQPIDRIQEEGSTVCTKEPGFPPDWAVAARDLSPEEICRELLGRSSFA